MLSHVHVGTNDFEAAFAFYSAILPVAGWELKFVERERPWAGWKPAGQDRPLFLLGAPYDGAQAQAGNGQMIALMAPSRRAVDVFHSRALGLGARCAGPPGLRPEYHPNYYGAYVRDLDGAKLCICCHEAA